VSRLAGLQYTDIDTTAVIGNYKPKTTEGIFDREFDALRAGMAERIDYGFAADPINLIANQGMQWTRPALDGNTEFDWRSSPLIFELPLDLRKCLFQTQGIAIAREQSL
jgi:hypothetical protein